MVILVRKSIWTKKTNLLLEIVDFMQGRYILTTVNVSKESPSIIFCVSQWKSINEVSQIG